jgi:CubicO group peptidase (beta-lactamase class C family)
VDVLGLVVEKVSGKSLGQFLDERLWRPLGMRDTSFALNEATKGRFAKPLPNDPETGKPQFVLHADGAPIKFECGGGCALSTASDYLRFAQMLLNRGTLDGQRILGPRTIAYMTADHLGPEIQNNV